MTRSPLTPSADPSAAKTLAHPAKLPRMESVGGSNPPEIGSDFRFAFTAIMAVFSAFALTDVILDWKERGALLHVLLEILAVTAALGSIVYIWRGVQLRLIKAESTIQDLREKQKEFRSRNDEILAGMRKAVREQYALWKLTPTEASLADSLIRGYTIEEIAAMGNKSRNTVRNQAAALYEKSGMTGRNDLTAFFLSDIMGEEEPDDELPPAHRGS